MFQFIRKHQAIGLIFIGIVIVSFVIFFSPNQSGGRGVPGGPIGSIRGEPITRDAYIDAAREASLSHRLREGEWPEASGRGWDEQREVFNRLFLLGEAKRLGIKVTDKIAASRIIELLRDDRTPFTRAAYDQLLAMIQQRGITRADFERFMRNEVALQHLVQLVGLSGTLVSPNEARARYGEANQRYTAQLATFSASNHIASVDLSPANIAQYYTNNMVNYRIPERVQVRYVAFFASNHVAEAEQQIASNTNLSQILDQEYQRRDPGTFRDVSGNPLSAEAAKEQILSEYREALSLETARKKANEFANRLYRLDPKADSVTQLATEMGLEARTSLPFDQFRPPADMRVPSTFNRAAFALSEAEPFATPIVGEDAVFVFAFERRVPAEFEPLDAVRGRVLDSMVRDESRRMAVAAGEGFAAAVTNAIAQGKTFEAVAAEMGIPTISVTNFSRSTMSLPQLGPRLTVSELLRAAADLEPGQVSDFVPGADGGFVMQLQAKEPVAEEDLQRELPDFLKQAQQFGRFSAFMEWERKRFALADVRTPADRSTNAAPAGSQP